jgi:hypothetical protein
MSFSSTKFKNTIFLLTQTFNELRQSGRYLLEEGFKCTQSNIFIDLNPKIGAAIKLKTKPELRLLAGEFYENSVKLDPRVNVVCLMHNVHRDVPRVKAKLAYDLVLTDESLSGDVVEMVRSYLETNFIKCGSGDYELRSIETRKSSQFVNISFKVVRIYMSTIN